MEVIVTGKREHCYNIRNAEFREPILQDCDVELDEFEGAIRKYKALCYDDICLWIVQNPKLGERGLLATEVHLWHHKSVDNKPRPYVALLLLLSLG
jgi:hypothetical protein